MLADASNRIVHFLAGRCPNSVGWLLSPYSGKIPVWWLPYALDNGAFVEFDENKFLNHLGRFSAYEHKPLWCVVPDAPGDAEKTLQLWSDWGCVVRDHGYKLAFAVQDGMIPGDVPDDADVVFIGGTMEWKIENAHKFRDTSKWYHIGKVSTPKRLQWAEGLRPDSVDGAGWFRDGGVRGNSARWLLDHMTNGRRQEELFNVAV
jgi:hypothetical protein